MSFDLMFHKASDLYLSGAYPQAEEILRQILAFSPENPDVLNMLGLVAAAQNEHNVAIGCFYEALKKSINPLPVYFNLAVSLNAAGKFKEALEAYTHCLKLSPQTKEIYNNMGAIYETLGNTDEAETYYKKAIEIDSNYVDALVNLALLKKDVAALEHIAKDYPNEILPLYHLALFAFDEANFEKALDFAQKADALESAYDVKNLMAQIYLKMADIQKAEKYFHQALLLNSKSVDALVNLAVLEKNESYFKKALDINPSSFEAHISYADFLYADGRKAEALEEYHKAVLLTPDDPALSNNVALVLKDMQDYKGALDLFLNAFLNAPKDENISINISETLVLLFESEPEVALKIAKLWQKNAPDNVYAAHTLSAFEKSKTANDQAYAEALFNQFAPLYDERMQQIGYNILSKINELKIDIKGKVLDLGCGTGLAAETFKTKNDVWTGVDVSENMLSAARQKNLYADLIKSDAVTFLKNNSEQYDFVLCLDVLPYINDVQALIQNCFPRKLILSFEKADDHVKTFALAPSGRYQMNEKYVENLLKMAGYQKIDATPLVLRKENQKDVAGVLIAASVS